MMKLRSILILGLILILLGAGFVYIKTHPTTKTKTATASEEPVIQLLKADVTKITKMVLTSENGDLTIEKKGADWVIPSVSGKLVQDNIVAIANSFSSLSADKLVEDAPKDIAKYGLDKPAYTAKATLSDGTEELLYIGAATPLGTSNYVMAKDKTKVYSVSQSSL